jgi:hypothetical protein
MGDECKVAFVNSRIERIKSRLPDIFNPDLNEILGILIGDGCIGISGYPRIRKQVVFAAT